MLSTSAAVTRLLADRWGLTGARVTPHPGGMSSLTWIVEDGPRRFAMKSVDAARYGESFTAGLDAARRVSDAGIPAGAPLAPLDSALYVLEDGCATALLAWVEGVPVEQDTPRGQAIIGRTLARVHKVLGTAAGHSRIEAFLDLSAPHLDVRPWIRPALTAACAELEALDVAGLTWGGAHGDPAAEAFREQPGGVCGLIDWGAYQVVPQVFDLASAVMYAYGIESAGPLIDAYLAEGALPEYEEVERSLETMLRWRWACQAWYFALRVATGDMTGIADPAENEEGLEDARAHLTAPRP